MKRISLLESIDRICRVVLKGHSKLEKKFFNAIDSPESKYFFDFQQVIAEIRWLASEYEDQVEKRITNLEKELVELKSLLNKNPSNSHKPPSSDRNKKIKNSRQKSVSPIGAQVGHEGFAHELHDNPDVIHRCDIQKCIECGGSLKDVPDHEIIRKQIIDIKEGKPHVTEYQRVIKYCPDCGRWNRADEPEGIKKSRIVFGPNVKAVAVYFIVWQLLPFWRVQQILIDLFGISISQGTLCNFVRESGEKLKNWEPIAKQALLLSKLNHVDETSIRCEKRNDWIHVVCNEFWTLLSYHPSRGQEAMDEIGVLPMYKGHLVHDAFSAYWNYGKTHSLCNGHILRELKYLAEEESQIWATPMSEFLKFTLHEIHSGHKRTAKWRATLRQKYIEILKQGYRENRYAREWKGRPPDDYKNSYENGKRVKVPIFRRRSHSKAMNLLNRLRDYETEILAFALKTDVPFTNNQAERDFRMAKLKEKISGCFRSPDMAKSFLRVRSFASTLKKQGQYLLENLVLVDICCEPV